MLERVRDVTFDRPVRVVVWTALALIAAIVIASCMPGVELLDYDGQVIGTDAVAPWLCIPLVLPAIAMIAILRNRGRATAFAGARDWLVLAIVGMLASWLVRCAADERAHYLWPRIFIDVALGGLTLIVGLVLWALFATPKPERLTRGTRVLQLAYAVLACFLAITAVLAMRSWTPASMWLVGLLGCILAFGAPAVVSRSHSWFVFAAAAALLATAAWRASFSTASDDSLELATNVSFALSIGIPTVAAFAIRAAAPPHEQLDTRRATLLRALASLMIIVAAAVSLLSLLPGSARGPWTFPVLAFLIGPALSVRTRPEARDGLTYGSWLCVVAIVIGIMWHASVVPDDSWAAPAVNWGLGVLFVLFVVVLPLVLVTTHGDFTRPVSIPRAEALRRGRAT